jgi:hypothetical protein
MIHEFEEIIMIQKWINHNQIKLTQRFPHLYPIIKKASKIDTHKFSIIVAEEFIIVSTCCTISIYTGQIVTGRDYAPEGLLRIRQVSSVISSAFLGA